MREYFSPPVPPSGTQGAEFAKKKHVFFSGERPEKKRFTP